MARIVLLDSGPLGLVTHPTAERSREVREWMAGLVSAGVGVVVPEITDYELRRKMLYIGSTSGVRRLDSLKETIEATPESAGYPLRKPLQGFRGIHTGRYRIIWRLLTLEEGDVAAEVIYVGTRSEGDQSDAYAAFQKLFNTLDL